MDVVQKPIAGAGLKSRPTLDAEFIGEVLWESAWSALIRAFLVQLLGGVALSILADVFREMAPSLPPIGAKLSPEASSSVLPGVWRFLVHNSFGLIFSALFLAIAAGRFTSYFRHPRYRRAAAFLLRLDRRISGHWFKLFVWNAFGAWISTMMLIVVQNLSWAHWIWIWITELLHPLFQTIERTFPGGGLLGRWYSWYGLNQVKFLFWLLYSAAICDDLGLPNYKTFLRLAGHRLRNVLTRGANVLVFNRARRDRSCQR
jgi:hypothetical protein